MRYFLSIIVLSLILFGGCGGDKSRPVDLPKLSPSKITITQEGVPLDGATVLILCTDSTVKYGSSSGTTDASGVATLRTYGYNGSPVGKYKVIVSKIITEENTSGKPLPKFALPDKYSLVDSKYGSAATSDLDVEIVQGNNEFNFDVGKPVRELVK